MQQALKQMAFLDAFRVLKQQSTTKWLKLRVSVNIILSMMLLINRNLQILGQRLAMMDEYCS